MKKGKKLFNAISIIIEEIEGDFIVYDFSINYKPLDHVKFMMNVALEDNIFEFLNKFHKKDSKVKLIKITPIHRGNDGVNLYSKTSFNLKDAICDSIEIIDTDSVIACRFYFKVSINDLNVDFNHKKEKD